jgi:putative endonuclease
MVERTVRVRFGREGEALAERYLEDRGYRLLARRFRLRNGEIDLVMKDGETVVFVEVRSRASSGLGHPFESIGGLKRSRLVRAARLFLAIHRLHDAPCRFDAVAVRFEGSGPPAIEHMKDAFRADG